MNTRRLIATIVSTTALVAGAAAGLAPAQAAGITHRLDDVETVDRTPLMDDCSLRAPCSVRAGESRRNAQVSSLESTTLAVERTARVSAVADRNVASIRAAARDRHLWSYAEDGTLELRVNGVLHRHGRLLQ